MGKGYDDLRDFLRDLERDGDLKHVTAPVDTHLEVTEIVTRVLKQQGPALVFDKPSTGEMPLAINVFGTDARMAKAIGASSLDEPGERLAEMLKPELPKGLAGLKDALGKLGELKSAPPKHVRNARCQEVVRMGDEVDLDVLPGIVSWPDDGGVFLNLGLTHTKHPETGSRNLGMYRLQKHDKRTLGMHWQIHKDSNAHHAVAERRGERLPVAIAFGCPPAVTYAASAPLPGDIDEYLFAGFVQRERVDLVDCLSVPLQVPAAAQVVLEGWVEPGERLPVAIAFGCPPAVTYAASAPLPADIDEYLFAGFLQRDRVELVDCVSVPLQVPAAAQVVVEGWVEPGARLPEGPFGDHTGFYTPVEPFPVLHVEKMTSQRDPIYHSIITSKPPQEDGGLGHATERIFLPLIKMLIPDIVDMALPEPGVFHNCLIVSIAKRYPKHAQKVMNAIWGAHLLSLTKLIVIVDEDCDPHDYHEVAFRAFGNVDYAHDLLLTSGPVDHLDHASYQQFWGGKAGLDATRKLATEGYTRGWPADAIMSPSVVATVNRRWKEYGL